MRTTKFASEIYWPLIVWTYKSLYKSVHCVNFFCYYYQGLSINYVISKLFFGPPQPSCCIFYSIGSFLVNRLSPRTETTYFMNGPVSVTLSFKLWYYSIHSFFQSWCDWQRHVREHSSPWRVSVEKQQLFWAENLTFLLREGIWHHFFGNGTKV